MKADEALRRAEMPRLGLGGLGAPTDSDIAAMVALAAEVRRLREENARYRNVLGDTVPMQGERIHVLTSTLARAEALLDEFCEGPGPDGEGPSIGAIERFLDRLGEILRGES